MHGRTGRRTSPTDCFSWLSCGQKTSVQGVRPTLRWLRPSELRRRTGVVSLGMQCETALIDSSLHDPGGLIINDVKEPRGVNPAYAQAPRPATISARLQEGGLRVVKDWKMIPARANLEGGTLGIMLISFPTGCWKRMATVTSPWACFKDVVERHQP